jgi:cytochrome c-type biogenesis protein CcmH/NrfG
MITLAYHREHPGVALSLNDTIRMLEWAHEVDPSNVLVNLALARLYSEKGQYDKARMLYRKTLLQVNPNSFEAMNTQSQIGSFNSRPKTKKVRKFGIN